MTIRDPHQQDLFSQPMSLEKQKKRIFLADHGAYLEQYFLKHVRNHSHVPQQKHLILLHSNLLASHLQFKLAQHGLPNYPLYFITLIDLAKIILKQLRIPLHKLLLQRDLELMKLYDICQQTFQVEFPNSDLSFLNNKPGFIQSLQHSFSYLQQNKIAHWPNKHEELLSIHTHYTESFLSHCFTQDSLIAFAHDSVLQHAQEPLPFHLSVYGFHAFTPVQHNLIDQANWLSQHIWMLQSNSEQNQNLGSFDQTWSIKAISPSAPPKSQHAIQEVSCAQQSHEIEHCVDTLTQWLNEDSNLLKTCAVLCPDQNYVRACQQAFVHASIPFYAPLTRTIGETFLGRMMHLLWTYNRSNKNRFELDKLITEFAFKKTVFAKQHKKQFFHGLNSQGILDEAHFLKLKTPDAECAYIQTFLNDLNAVFKHASNWKQFFQQLETFFLQHLNQLIDSNHWHAADDALIWFELERSCQSLDHLNIPYTQNHLDFFFARFFLRNCPDKTKKLHASGVFLAPIDHAAFFNFDRLIVLGLNHDRFPKPDQNLPLLEGSGSSLQDLYLGHTQQMQMNVLKNIIASAEHCTLTFAKNNVLNDQEQQRSVIFDQLSTQKVTFCSKSFCKTHTRLDFDHHVLAPAIQKHKLNVLNDLSALSLNLNNQAAWAKEHLIETPRFSRYSGQLPALPESKKNFSVSALQDYARCPYQYFLSRMLHLKNHAWPDDLYGLHYLDKGQIIHQILFLLYQRCMHQPNISLEQKIRWLKEIVNQQQAAQYTLKKDQLWNKEILSMFQILQSYISDEHFKALPFTPYALEMRFGAFKSEAEDKRYSNDEPLSLHYQNQSVYFHGKIDRVDMHHDQQHLHVIDYKTGSVSHKKNNDFQNGQNIQLAIYLLLCEQTFPNIPLQNMRASMISIDPKQGFGEKKLTGTFLDAHRDEFLNLIFSLCTHLNMGQFVQNPGSNAIHCRNCDFTSICQSHVQKRAQHIQQDPQLNNLMEIL